MKIDKFVFDFLRDLRLNNNREWFKANKHRYDEARSAFEQFTADFIRLAASIDPEVGAPAPKECMFRIYRDVRFSHDKQPYKTDFCCGISRKGKNGPAPKYFFSIEPDNTFFASGRYCLEPEELKKVRREICNFPEELLAAVESERFKKRMYLWDNRLKNIPKGFDTDFVGAEYLKYKSLSPIVDYTEEECQAADFEAKLRNDIETAMPLNRFLKQALDAPEEEKYDF
ncbi:MAG: DUF2461 domain-containing protein [Bacteroidales bacterium]|nr:DUF2461 domain-containing protein [Bacteroidales bacterium]